MSDVLATDIGFQDFLFARNKNYHTIDAADVNLTERTTLKYFLELQIPQLLFSGDFVPLHESEGREKPLNTGPGGSTIFEGVTFPFNQRNGKIDGFLEYEKPKFDNYRMQTVVAQTMQYRLKERITGGIPAQNISRTLTSGWAIKAGLAAEDQGHTDFWTTQQNTNRRFLTWQPNNQTVGKTQEIYLSFLINFSPVPATVNLRIKYTSMSFPITLQSVSNIQFGNVLVIPLRPDKAININEKSFEVWLSREDGKRISEVRKYYIDQQKPEFERTIIYANSLGGWDSLRLTGAAENALAVTKVTARREKYKKEGIEYVPTLNILQESTNQLTVSTGWSEGESTAKKKILAELIHSDQVFLVTTKGHRFVEISENELISERDDETVFSRTLTFNYTDEDSHFSNLSGAGVGAVQRPTGWRGVEYTHILNSFGKRTGNMIATRLQRIYTDDNSIFKPLTYKFNTVGTEGYVPPLQNSAITAGSTPFPSTAISREGSFIRAVCSNGGTPGPATITIPAAKYGGEKAGDGDALAELEFSQLDTQAYADANGACYPDPWSYAMSVPANKAHFRWNTMRSNSYADHYAWKHDANYSVQKGNAWHLQANGAGGQVDVYTAGTNNIQLPTNFATGGSWKFGFYGSGIAKIYVNGTLINTTNCVNAPDNFTMVIIPHGSIPSGAKVYVLFV